MPIYSDYHGDFQNSNNSSWDQIQASLKILLSYSLILTNPDPEIQNSEAEFDEGDAATIQNATKFTDPTTISNPAPEIQTTVQSPEITASKIHNLQEDEDESGGRSIYLGCDDRSATIVVQQPPPEPPDLNSVAVTGTYSGAEDGAVAKGNVEDVMTEPNSRNSMDGDEDVKPKTEIGVAVIVEDRTVRLETELRKTAVVSKVGGEDKAADLNSGDQAGVVDNGTMSSVKVGASVRGMCTSMTLEGGTRPRAFVVGGECITLTSRGVEGGAVATVADGGLVMRLLRRFILLTPPPLLAAVLPWDREDRRRTEGDQHRRTVPAPPCELARQGGSSTDGTVASSL
ncbi:hypothetical protein PIB30_082522 [Stylosanthes scabra]|uniref:Uncharacterized protein n=1 Tax=Stylosanthes scabra TaxID=79078 RepID=A0ABU6VRV3_9FABA|nr:hypothetical protein [Stylosanthes scabra]